MAERDSNGGSQPADQPADVHQHGGAKPITGPRVGGRRTLPTTADTEELGAQLAAQLVAGDLVILDGPLGAGKTAMTRGIARGLGVAGRVSSPTFIIARQHPPATSGRPGLVHVDAYRLTGLDDLDSLDLDTDLTESVVVVEWGEGIAENLVDDYLMVRLRRGSDGESTPDDSTQDVSTRGDSAAGAEDAIDEGAIDEVREAQWEWKHSE